MRSISLLCWLLLLPAGIGAANLAQERRISEQLAGPALVGEAQWLRAGDVEFLAILQKSSAAQRLGGAILLHDAGDHADARELISPLRQALTDHGWDTLSLQLPRPAEPLTAEGRAEAVALGTARLQAAVAFFQSTGTRPLVLVGHGLGAETALAYLSGNPAGEVRALAAIGLAAGPAGEADPVIQAIARLQLPMLDLYGERDRAEVLATARLRSAAAKRAGHADYRQDLMAGADHHFSGLQESLQRRIAAWLRRVAQAAGR